MQVLLQLYLELRHKIESNMHLDLHIVETAPSVFREIPWLKIIEYKVQYQKIHDYSVYLFDSFLAIGRTTS